MRTEFEFVLPRGYVDEAGTVHKRGVMRLATARDELQPLREPSVTGPDDPRLTLLVLTRVIVSLGSLPMVTVHEVEGLFAADLAYLQDFYGVINFGSDADIEALLAAQGAGQGQGATPGAGAPPSPPTHEVAAAEGASPPAAADAAPDKPTPEPSSEPAEPRPISRRMAVQEVPSGSR